MLRQIMFSVFLLLLSIFEMKCCVRGRGNVPTNPEREGMSRSHGVASWAAWYQTNRSSDRWNSGVEIFFQVQANQVTHIKSPHFSFVRRCTVVSVHSHYPHSRLSLWRHLQGCSAHTAKFGKNWNRDDLLQSVLAVRRYYNSSPSCSASATATP